MSTAAFLRATLDTLRASVPGMTKANSGVHYNGQPPPENASALYLAIHPNAWRPGPSADIHEAIEEEYGITLAVNFRTSVIPRDRWGSEAYLNESRSIEAAARMLLIAMHAQRYRLLKLANDYAGIDSSVGNQMIEPLLFDGAPLIPSAMPAEWFHAQPEGDMINIPDGHRIDRSGKRKTMELTTGAADPLQYHGLLLEMNYFGGRRIIPSDKGTYWITVTFQATREPSPAVSGTYGGEPDSINVNILGSDYTPTFNAGVWSIPAGTVTFAGPGVYDAVATAVYNAADVTVKDETVDEITIIDPSDDWLWSDGSPNVWTSGDPAQWT